MPSIHVQKFGRNLLSKKKANRRPFVRMAHLKEKQDVSVYVCVRVPHKPALRCNVCGRQLNARAAKKELIKEFLTYISKIHSSKDQKHANQ